MTPDTTIRPARPADLGPAKALLLELKLTEAGVSEWWHTFIVAETNDMTDKAGDKVNALRQLLDHYRTQGYSRP